MNADRWAHIPGYRNDCHDYYCSLQQWHLTGSFFKQFESNGSGDGVSGSIVWVGGIGGYDGCDMSRMDDFYIF